ncbi:TetR/AcrR family transcriptional regulator [Actinoplanes sp. NPDC051513]|uniref:TetR/AcrR family transcriptional regulator n=1 Tax=Actinoplanes sp. NPDC051513 TaxID=3363908 RepID=UPI00379C347A
MDKYGTEADRDYFISYCGVRDRRAAWMMTWAEAQLRDAGGPRRADARRNIEAILDAAAVCLSRKPTASIAEIARTAGVGRMTLYGHFPTRAALIERVVVRTLDETETALEALDLAGDARAALARLVETSWLSIVQIGGLMEAATTVLPAERMLVLHSKPAARVDELIERGRRTGEFRTDLPAAWLVGTLHRIMHGAADDIRAGRLAADDAARVITVTALAVFTPDPSTRSDTGRTA